MKKKIISVLSHLVLLSFVAWTLYPVLWIFKMALSQGEMLNSPLSPFAENPSLEGFSQIFSQKDPKAQAFFTYMLNSLKVAGITSFFSVLISCSAAYGFSRLRFPGSKLGLKAIIFTQMLPGVVMMIPIYTILNKLNLLNSHWGLILVYSSTAIPFCTWTLKGYFDTLPIEIEEAAFLDGANRFQVFYKIILPLSGPAIAITALFSFMTAWNEFILAATLLNHESLFTAPVALQRFVGEYQTSWGQFAAGSILTSIPVVLLFYLLQKQLVSGLTAGAVKS